jgi:hypothetical protein
LSDDQVGPAGRAVSRYFWHLSSFFPANLMIYQNFCFVNNIFDLIFLFIQPVISTTNIESLTVTLQVKPAFCAKFNSKAKAIDRFNWK